MKVLIADDSAVTRRVLDKQVKKWGYETIVVENGQQAWEILSGGDPPGIAILDWVMPDMSGLDVCEAFRQLDCESFTHIIILTIKDEAEDIMRALEAGAHDYLKKPCSPIELRARLLAAEREVRLEQFLKAKVRELEEVMERQRTIEQKINVFLDHGVDIR